MKRKIFKVALTLAFVFTIIGSYPVKANVPNADENKRIFTLEELEENDYLIEINEGETAVIPFEFTDNPSSRAIVQSGPAGYVELTPKGTYLYYHVVPSVPTISFVGSLKITNLTDGFLSGYYTITNYSGNKYYEQKYLYKYMANMSGSCYIGAIEVMYIKQPCTIMWTGNGR